MPEAFAHKAGSSRAGLGPKLSAYSRELALSAVAAVRVQNMNSQQSPSLFRLVHGIRAAVQAFFKADVALQRQTDGVHIVLKDRPPPAPKPGKPATREELVARRDKEELQLMLEQLAQLLDELPETRDTLRHLVFVEKALAKKGLRALHKLPLDVLQRALEQLEGLVTNWTPAGLASLRSRMAVSIIDREHMDPEAEADAFRTAAVIDTMPVVPQAAQAAECSDDEALAAAYAALGDVAPGAVAMQGELSSPSARAIEREVMRPLSRAGTAPDAIKLRELQH